MTRLTSKIALAVTVPALLCAVSATSASACEFHSGGGWFGVRSSAWQNFDPRATYQDPAFMDETEKAADITPITKRPARPSFSNAADRASRAAKARLGFKVPVKTEQDETRTAESRTDDDWAPRITIRKSTLEADAQPVR